MKRTKIKDLDIKSGKDIDTRPLNQRVTKRIKPNQKPDAVEQLFFTPFTVYCGVPKDRR
jgi:hypothetical protein